MNLSSLFSGNAEFGLFEFVASLNFSLLAAIVWSLAYRLYWEDKSQINESLAKSFPFIAPAVTAIFWAIQYSLPLSLGLLGALSFVRFRTPIKKSEDIGFLLSIIAIALLSSIYRFQAACILMAVLIALIVIVRLWRKTTWVGLFTGTQIMLFVHTKKNESSPADEAVRRCLESGIKNMGKKSVLLQDVVKKEDGFSLNYRIHVRAWQKESLAQITDALNALDEVDHMEMYVAEN